MKIISTSQAREHLSELVSTVHRTRRPIAIGRRKKGEVLLIHFPEGADAALGEMTNINLYGGAFDFLDDEPALYSRADLKKSYV